MKTNVNLQHDVLEELVYEPSVDAAKIGVTVHNGIITLSGHVPHCAEKHAAEEAAKRVSGVKAVANEIEVRLSDSHQLDDEELAAAALRCLEWDARAPHDGIKITVDQGWITLEGSVVQEFQRKAVERRIRNLIGVRGVTNSIEIAPRSSVADETLQQDSVKESVEAALMRSALLALKQVFVELEGDAVVLTGDVHTRAEYEEAERIAWARGEVSRVENCLTITPWGHGPSDEWGY